MQERNGTQDPIDNAQQLRETIASQRDTFSYLLFGTFQRHSIRIQNKILDRPHSNSKPFQAQKP